MSVSVRYKTRQVSKTGKVRLVHLVRADLVLRFRRASEKLEVKPAAMLERALEFTLPSFERGLDPDPSVGRAFAEPA